MQQKILNLLGIAKKAGLLITGYDAVLDGVQQNKIKLVFVGSDCSDSTKETFNKKCSFHKTDINMEFTSTDLSHAIGTNRKIIGVTDNGIYKTLIGYVGGEKV
ncbi:MAG: ribosomal L7Ae/L30e/S12e/Gadd45 family protein [Bacilli bacterium]